EPKRIWEGKRATSPCTAMPVKSTRTGRQSVQGLMSNHAAWPPRFRGTKLTSIVTVRRPPITKGVVEISNSFEPPRVRRTSRSPSAMLSSLNSALGRSPITTLPKSMRGGSTRKARSTPRPRSGSDTRVPSPARNRISPSICPSLLGRMRTASSTASPTATENFEGSTSKGPTLSSTVALTDAWPTFRAWTTILTVPWTGTSPKSSSAGSNSNFCRAPITCSGELQPRASSRGSIPAVRFMHASTTDRCRPAVAGIIGTTMQPLVRAAPHHRPGAGPGSSSASLSGVGAAALSRGPNEHPEDDGRQAVAEGRGPGEAEEEGGGCVEGETGSHHGAGEDGRQGETILALVAGEALLRARLGLDLEAQPPLLEIRHRLPDDQREPPGRVAEGGELVEDLLLDALAAVELPRHALDVGEHLLQRVHLRDEL